MEEKIEHFHRLFDNHKLPLLRETDDDQQVDVFQKGKKEN